MYPKIWSAMKVKLVLIQLPGTKLLLGYPNEENSQILHAPLQLYFPGLLAGPSGIRVGWGIETNGRFEAERLSTSVGPPSGGRAATFVPYV